MRKTPLELVFCGENRKRELKRLADIFDEVRACAEAAGRSGAPRGPNHHVVMIHAERGMGKTRMAMELYKHLAITADPGNYWPSNFERMADQVAVTPAPEACDFEPIPSFLWWGMQVSPNPVPGDTLFAALPALLPHLVTMRVAKRRSETGRDLTTELGDTAFDIGLIVASEGLDLAAEAAQLGVVKRVGQAALRIGRLIYRQNQASRTPLDQKTEQSQSVAEEVLTDLDRILNPSSRSYARRPVVILIDDAQFADRDPSLAAFLERLLARSARQRWPLFLLVTHWSRELQPWRDASDRPHPSSKIAQVLDHARNGAPTDSGPLAGERGVTLPADCFTEIDLCDAVDDLTPALYSVYPRLHQDTAATIIERSSGNPRWLEQLVEKLRRKPRWFIDHDQTQDLTPEGLAATLALSTLSIDEIVYDRLCDAPADVRRSLALASCAGNRFVVEFIDRLASAKVDMAARPNLLEGDRTYRFVADISDRDIDDIGRFRDRLLLDAASEYRTNARHDFGESWPDDRTLFQALDALLEEFVDDPGQFQGLRDADHALILEAAGERLIAAGNAKAGLALARLVHLENGRGNLEGAYAAAERFIQGFQP